MALTPVTVTGSFRRPDGVADRGEILFELTEDLFDPATDTIVAPDIQRAVFDANGEFSIDLVATDDAGVIPVGVMYHVTEHHSWGRTVEYFVELPNSSAPSVDLTTLVFLSGLPSSLGSSIVSAIASKVAKAGDIMSGPLVLSGDPASALHAAPKQFVDASVATEAATARTMEGLKLAKASNLSDVADASTALANLAGLATQAYGRSLLGLADADELADELSGTFVAQTMAQSGATEKRMFTVTTDAAVPVSFAASVAQATFNGTAEALFNHGFNIAAGTFIDATKPGFHVGLEYDYNDGASRKAEWYVQYSKAVTGYYIRPFGFQIDKTSFAATIDLNIGTTAGAVQLSYGDSNAGETIWGGFAPVTSYLKSTLNLIGAIPALTVGDGTASNPVSVVLNSKAGQANVLSWQIAGVEAWRLSQAGGGGSLILADVINGRTAVQFWPGSSTTSEIDFNNPVLFNNKVGFYGTAPVAKPTVTGSRGANAALASLLTALASQGILTDSSS